MFKKEILKSDLCVICETEEQAKLLLKWGHKQGYRWYSGDSFLYKTMFNHKRTAYCIYEGYVINADSYIPDESLIAFDEALLISKTQCKYILLKNICAKSIFEYDPCSFEFSKFIQQYSYNEVKWTKEIEDKFSHENGWIEFLLNKGFIKTIDRFEIQRGKIKQLKREIKEREEKIKLIMSDIGEFKVKDKSWMCSTSNTESVEEWDEKPNMVTIVDYVNVKNELIGDTSKEEYKDFEKFCYYDVELKCVNTGKHYYGFSWFLQ